MSTVPPNALKARALAGETVLGALVFEFFSPGMPQVLKAADCEFALFDMEHSGLGFETLKMLFAACRGIGLAPMVRVPRSEYHFLARALDVGAHGVMVPMVESAEEARRIVEATHYPPQGRRGAAFGIAQDDYRGGDVKAKVAELNARTLVIAQIESERGLAEVEGIAATPGVDVLWLGHFDLTNFLGIPGEFEHPQYLAAIEAIVAAARRNGKGLGFMAADETWAARYRALGFNMIAAGLDQTLLQSAIRRTLAPLRRGT
ncbi:MAG TPA: aldolase/citrate lyase family protein [Burkholderiales bacterium]|nr:aldolase/citrate lyase family protein [Burkholderiales bacterium]